MLRSLPAIVLLPVVLGISSCGDGGDTTAGTDSLQPATGPLKEVADRTAGCLEQAGYATFFGSRQKGDADAPDWVVAFSRGDDMSRAGEIALYETDEEAARKRRGVEANAAEFDGVVDAHGSVTVVYFGDPGDATRADARECLSS